MDKLIAILKREPLVIFGALAAGAIAVVQSLGGHGVISGDAVNWVVNALHVPSTSDPSTGPGLAFLVALVGRFLVYSPAAHEEAVTEALNTPAPGQAQTGP